MLAIIYKKRGGLYMNYTKLGRSGMDVSRLCLGTMNFGGSTDEKEAFKIMDAALDAGVNFFDTSNNYNGGTTEEIIGRWFAQGGGRREKVILGTKVHEDMHDVNDGPNSAPGLSTYKIRRHLEASMKRLQTDHLEIYYMHHIDRRVSWEELWGTFENIFAQGIIDYVGSSNFAGWQIAVAQAEAKARHFFGLTVEQHLYNLDCRLPELEVLPSAKAHGVGVVTWSPLSGGLLARNALNRSSNVGRTWNNDRINNQRKQLEQYSQLCRELNEYEDNVALAWLLANPAVTAPVVGPRTLEQFEQALRAVDIVLSEDVMKRLDEIFPGPGGAAPEAYGW
jgi:aryl-alcohol dehydrogenase-like predicted oxidoreductase